MLAGVRASEMEIGLADEPAERGHDDREHDGGPEQAVWARVPLDHPHHYFASVACSAPSMLTRTVLSPVSQ